MVLQLQIFQLKVIQDQNGISYTLPIYRENQSNEYFENLVIKVDNSNQTLHTY